MRTILKTAAALLVGLGALGLSTAFADDDDHRDRDHNYRGDDHRSGDDDHERGGRYDRGRDHDRDDHRRYGDRRYDDHGDDRRRSDDHRRRDHDRDDHRRYGDHRYDDHRYDGRNYRGGRPARCSINHDHRYHDRNYYSFYPRDRYYDADPEFSISLSFGNGGYYDRGGRYYDRPYSDRRGYRDQGRVVNREVYRIRGYRAEAVLVEEAYYGRRGSDLVCTVTARGPDARYVPYGQLRSIAARECSRRSDIRVYA